MALASINFFCQMMFYLVVGHAVADRPMQTDLMRAEKNRKTGRMWLYGLANHGLIHGGAVALATGHWWLGAAETVIHGLIDDAKCMGRIGLSMDQGLHIACKVVWALISLDIAIRTGFIR